MSVPEHLFSAGYNAVSVSSVESTFPPGVLDA